MTRPPTRALRCAMRWAWAMVTACMLVGCAATTAASNKRLHGTVIQFKPAHQLWVRSDWAQLIQSLRALGMTQIVVQWTVADTTAYYDSRQFRSGPMPPLGLLLDAAGDADMRVLVGLVHDSKYWARIGGDATQAERYLRELRMRSMQAARELAPRLKQHRAFEGWYLSEEIDDLNWRDAPRRAVLADHLRSFSGELRALDPRARVAISGFANTGTDPVYLHDFWLGLLGDAPDLGILLFQDGVGVRKLGLDELAPVLGAVQRAAESRQRELRLIIEVFQQTAGPPIDQKPFAAEPAPLERIRRQIAIEQAFSSTLLAFSVPDYMNAKGPAAVTNLFNQYRRACVEAEC